MSCPCVVNELMPTSAEDNIFEVLCSASYTVTLRYVGGGIFSCVSSWNVGVSEAAFVTVLLTV